MLSSIASNRSHILLNSDRFIAPDLGLNCGYLSNDVYIDLAGPRHAFRLPDRSLLLRDNVLFNAFLRPVASTFTISKSHSLLSASHLSYQEERRFDSCLTSIEENANYQQSEFHNKPNLLKNRIPLSWKKENQGSHLGSGRSLCIRTALWLRQRPTRERLRIA